MIGANAHGTGLSCVAPSPSVLAPRASIPFAEEGMDLRAISPACAPELFERLVRLGVTPADTLDRRAFSSSRSLPTIGVGIT